jgi:hypothetical protein
MLRELTEKQIVASRANGAKSRGPVTQDGKRNAARKNLRHAMLAKCIVLVGESATRFRTLLDSFHDELKPESAIEDILVHKLTVAYWRQMRTWDQQKASIAHEVDKQDASLARECPSTRDALAIRTGGPSLTHDEMRYDRQFHAALSRFMKYRASKVHIPAVEPVND